MQTTGTIEVNGVLYERKQVECKNGCKCCAFEHKGLFDCPETCYGAFDEEETKEHIIFKVKQ